MQNKPNLPDAQMNANSISTKDYENKRLRRCVKTNPIQTQYKANTKPIPEKPKMKLNSYSTKDYENKPPSSPKKTNPIQTQSNPISKAKKYPPKPVFPPKSQYFQFSIFLSYG